MSSGGFFLAPVSLVSALLAGALSDFGASLVVVVACAHCAGADAASAKATAISRVSNRIMTPLPVHGLPVHGVRPIPGVRYRIHYQVHAAGKESSRGPRTTNGIPRPLYCRPVDAAALARLWSLDPSVAFLNHGSYCACPS